MTFLVPTLWMQPVRCASEYYREHHILCWARMSSKLWCISIFHDFSMTYDTFKDFHDISRPRNQSFEFHDFSRFSMTPRTLHLALAGHIECSFKKLLKDYFSPICSRYFFSSFFLHTQHPWGIRHAVCLTNIIIIISTLKQRSCFNVLFQMSDFSFG